VAGWSPEGSTLAYWEHTAADYEDNPQYPPGTFTLTDLAAGTSCRYPRELYDGRLAGNGAHTWLADGRLLVFTKDGAYTLGQPCSAGFEEIQGDAPEPIAEVVTADETRRRFLLRGASQYWLLQVGSDDDLTFVPVAGPAPNVSDNAAFSPAGERVAVNRIQGGSVVVDSSNGEVVYTIAWQAPGAEGDIFPPLWLSDTQFLISTSLQGPLIVDENGDAIFFVPDFFGLESNQFEFAQGVPTAAGDYAILLRESVRNLWLYHSDNGEVESLDFSRVAFAPNGEWLVLHQDREEGVRSHYEVWVRPLAPAGAEPTQLLSYNQFLYTAFSPGGDLLAVVAGDHVLVFDKAAGAHGVWQLSDFLYGGVPHLSPDGRYLAIAGALPGQLEEGLFLLPVE
jgi:hypothetical protein